MITGQLLRIIEDIQTGAYGKAGNGNGTETGNGNWKWKLETEMGTKNAPITGAMFSS